MEQRAPKTREKILESGQREFLDKGFLRASLRVIVREAGVTTWAFYGYFSSKEALFDALVEKEETFFMTRFIQAQKAFTLLEPQEQTRQLGDVSRNCMLELMDYMYSHRQAFLLLLTKAEGTKHQDFVHRLVEIEAEGTHRYLDVLAKLGSPVQSMAPWLEHVLLSGMFSAYFEPLLHDVGREEAMDMVKQIQAFYLAGWKQLMGV